MNPSIFASPDFCQSDFAVPIFQIKIYRSIFPKMLKTNISAQIFMFWCMLRQQQYKYFRVWWLITCQIGGLREGLFYVVGVVIVGCVWVC